MQKEMQTLALGVPIMGRPTIGITSPFEWIDGASLGNDELSNHAKLLQSFGATTVLLPRGQATAQALDTVNLDGLLFSGGGDISASWYEGYQELVTDRVDQIRDSGEFALVRRALEDRVPMLCVCRGLQLANVAFGGTLVEDLPTELGSNYRISHDQVRELRKPAFERTHEVTITMDSTLERIVRSRSIWTNSLHHQAIRSLAVPLVSSASTSDGVVEAIELRVPDFFFIGVQWHPELLPKDESSTRIYEAFVKAAQP